MMKTKLAIVAIGAATPGVAGVGTAVASTHSSARPTRAHSGGPGAG